MYDFGPMEFMDMMSKVNNVMEAVKYLKAHENDIPEAMEVFNKYISASELNSNNTVTLMQLYSSGMFEAIISYADSIAKILDAANRFTSYHEEVVIIHNPEDILQKLKEAKDNGDNNS